MCLPLLKGWLRPPIERRLQNVNWPCSRERSAQSRNGTGRLLGINGKIFMARVRRLKKRREGVRILVIGNPCTPIA